MDEPSLYNGAPLAKCELLARLQNNPNFVPRTDAEVRANIAAAIDAIRREPWDTSGDGDELVEQPAPVPVPSHRQRKRSLAKVCEIARRAGANHVIVDGVVIAFSPSAAVPKSDANEWDAVLSEADHASH